MKNNEFESSNVKRIDREAAEWVAKKIGGFTAKDQDVFFDWLAADPRHGEWYENHQKTWKELDLLAQWLPEHSDRPNQDLLKYHIPAVFLGLDEWYCSCLDLGVCGVCLNDSPWDLRIRRDQPGRQCLRESRVARRFRG